MAIKIVQNIHNWDVKRYCYVHQQNLLWWDIIYLFICCWSAFWLVSKSVGLSVGPSFCLSFYTSIRSQCTPNPHICVHALERWRLKKNYDGRKSSRALNEDDYDYFMGRMMVGRFYFNTIFYCLHEKNNKKNSLLASSSHAI